MGIIFLDRIDAAPLANDDFTFEFNSWVANTIDTLNEDLSDTENQLSGLGLATFVTPMPGPTITALINMNAQPVLPLGSLWFDTTAGKLRVLTTAAVFGVSNGVTQLVTSV